MYLVKFCFDAGRDGSLSGVFVVNPEGHRRLHRLVALGAEVEFGEVLGKHSNVVGPIEAQEIEVSHIGDAAGKTILKAFKCKLNPLGWATLSGYNPLDYLDGEALGAFEVADES